MVGGTADPAGRGAPRGRPGRPRAHRGGGGRGRRTSTTRSGVVGNQRTPLSTSNGRSHAPTKERVDGRAGQRRTVDELSARARSTVVRSRDAGAPCGACWPWSRSAAGALVVTSADDDDDQRPGLPVALGVVRSPAATPRRGRRRDAGLGHLRRRRRPARARRRGPAYRLAGEVDEDQVRDARRRAGPRRRRSVAGRHRWRSSDGSGTLEVVRGRRRLRGGTAPSPPSGAVEPAPAARRLGSGELAGERVRRTATATATCPADGDCADRADDLDDDRLRPGADCVDPDCAVPADAECRRARRRRRRPAGRPALARPRPATIALDLAAPPPASTSTTPRSPSTVPTRPGTSPSSPASTALPSGLLGHVTVGSAAGRDHLPAGYLGHARAPRRLPGARHPRRHRPASTPSAAARRRPAVATAGHRPTTATRRAGRRPSTTSTPTSAVHGAADGRARPARRTLRRAAAATCRRRATPADGTRATPSPPVPTGRAPPSTSRSRRPAADRLHAGRVTRASRARARARADRGRAPRRRAGRWCCSRANDGSTDAYLVPGLPLHRRRRRPRSTSPPWPTTPSRRRRPPTRAPSTRASRRGHRSPSTSRARSSSRTTPAAPPTPSSPTPTADRRAEPLADGEEPRSASATTSTSSPEHCTGDVRARRLVWMHRPTTEVAAWADLGERHRGRHVHARLARPRHLRRRRRPAPKVADASRREPRRGPRPAPDLRSERRARTP